MLLVNDNAMKIILEEEESVAQEIEIPIKKEENAEGLNSILGHPEKWNSSKKSAKNNE